MKKSWILKTFYGKDLLYFSDLKKKIKIKIFGSDKLHKTLGSLPTSVLQIKLLKKLHRKGTFVHYSSKVMPVSIFNV